MAERRMFSKVVIDSDTFLDMPLSAQALYFHMSMRADDDGFVSNPKRIQTYVGASTDDLKILLAKHFLIPFESGVVVIKHWKVHNYIQKDRYKETYYQAEKALLEEAPKTKEYTRKLNLDTNCIQTVSNLDTNCIQTVSNLDTQVRDRDRDSIEIETVEGRDRVEVETKYIYCREENREAEEKSLSAFVGRADNASVLTKNVINYLNEKANKNYKSSTAKTKALINARAREGFALEDFKKVIDIKTREWKGSDMERYLRPETLFGTKFEGYLNESMIVKKSTDGSRKANELNNFYNMAAEWAAGKDDYDPATEQ